MSDDGVRSSGVSAAAAPSTPATGTRADNVNSANSSSSAGGARRSRGGGKRKRSRGDDANALPPPSAAAPANAEEEKHAAEETPQQPHLPPQWGCPACTFLNDQLRAFCEMCGTTNPAPSTRAASASTWSCVACTVTNPSGLRVCAICGTINPQAPLRHAALSIGHRSLPGGLHDDDDDDDDAEDDDDDEEDDDDDDDDSGDDSSASTWTCRVCDSDELLAAGERTCPECFSARRKSPSKARRKSPSKPKRSAYGVSSDVLRKLALEPASSKLTDTLQTLTHTLAMMDASTDAEWGDLRGASMFIRGFGGASALTASSGAAKDPELLAVLGEIFSEQARAYSLEVRLLAVQSINYLMKMDRHLFGRAMVLHVVDMYLNDLFVHWGSDAGAGGDGAHQSARMIVEECLNGMASVCNFEGYALRELVSGDHFGKYLDFVARLVEHESGFHSSILVTSLDLLQKCCVRMRWGPAASVGSAAAATGANGVQTSESKTKLPKPKKNDGGGAQTASTTAAQKSLAKAESVMTMELAKKVVGLLRRTLAHKHVALHVKAAKCLLLVFHRIPLQHPETITELVTEDVLAELIALVTNASGVESEDSRQAVITLLIQLFDNRPRLVSVLVQKQIYNSLFEGVLPLLRSTSASPLGAAALKLTALLARLVCRKHATPRVPTPGKAPVVGADGAPLELTRQQHRARLDSAPDPDVLATLLLDFVRADSVPAVSVLLKDGADLNFPRLIDVNGQEIDKPLQVAAECASLAMVRYLVKRGADVHQSGPGGTALHVAARCGRCDVVSFLLQCGASVKAVDREGKSAVQCVPDDSADAFPSPVRRLLEIHRKVCHLDDASDHSEGEHRRSSAGARAWFVADDDDQDLDDDDLDDDDDDEDGYYMHEYDDDDDEDGDDDYHHYRNSHDDDEEISSNEEDEQQTPSKQVASAKKAGSAARVDPEKVGKKNRIDSVSSEPDELKRDTAVQGGSQADAHTAAVSRKEDVATLRRQGFVASEEEICDFSRAILRCLLSVLYDVDIQNVERSVLSTLASVLEMVPPQLVRILSDRDVVLVLDMVHFLLQGQKLDQPQQQQQSETVVAVEVSEREQEHGATAGSQLKANLSSYILALRILQAVVRKASPESSIFYQIERRGICEQIEQLDAKSTDLITAPFSSDRHAAATTSLKPPPPRTTIFKRGLVLLDALRANMMESGMLHLHKLKNLARRMREMNESSTAEERELAVLDLVELFEHPNSITTYEFKQSELLPAVLHFVAPGRQVDESRVRLLLRAFESCPEGLKHLVFRLQNIITHEESFNVVSYNPGKGRELYPLTRQLKISFSRIQASDALPNEALSPGNEWTASRDKELATTKMIHSSPLTHFQSFERTVARCLAVHDPKVSQLYVNLVGHSIHKVVDGKWKKFWVCGYDAKRSFHLLKPIGELSDELVEMVLHDSQYKLTGSVDVYQGVRVDLGQFGAVESGDASKDGKKKRRATNKRKRKLSLSKSEGEDGDWRALCDVEVRNEGDLDLGKLKGAWYGGYLVVETSGGDGKAKPSGKSANFDAIVKPHGSYSVKVDQGKRLLHKVPAAALRKRLKAPQLGSVVEVDGSLGEVTNMYKGDGSDLVDVKVDQDVEKVRVKKDRIRFLPPSAKTSDPDTDLIEAMSIRRMFPARDSSIIAGCVGDRVWVSPRTDSAVKDLHVAGTIKSFPSGLESIREASSVYVEVSFGLEQQPPVIMKVQQDRLINFANGSRKGGTGSRLLAALQMASGRGTLPQDGLFGGGSSGSAFRQAFQQVAGPLRSELDLGGRDGAGAMDQLRQLISRSSRGAETEMLNRDVPVQVPSIGGESGALSARSSGGTGSAAGAVESESEVTRLDLSGDVPSTSTSRTSSPVPRRGASSHKRPSEGSESTRSEELLKHLERDGDKPEWVCSVAPKVNLQLAFRSRESAEAQLDLAIANSRAGGGASKSSLTVEDKKVKALLFSKAIEQSEADLTVLKPVVRAALLEIFKTFETVAPRGPSPKKKRRRVASTPPAPMAGEHDAPVSPWDVDRFCAFMKRGVGWPAPSFRNGADASCVEQCVLFAKFATAASARRRLDFDGFVELLTSFCRQTANAKLLLKHLHSLGYSDAYLSKTDAASSGGGSAANDAISNAVMSESKAAASRDGKHRSTLHSFPADQNVLKCLQVLQEDAAAVDASSSGVVVGLPSTLPPWKYVYKVYCDFVVDWTSDASHPSPSTSALSTTRDAHHHAKKRKLNAKKAQARGSVGDRVHLRFGGEGGDLSFESLDKFKWLDEREGTGGTGRGAASPVASAICLLLYLYDFNATSGRGAVVHDDVWTSPRLYNKLETQLQDVLSVCSGIYPKWCDRIVTQCRFFFPRELREKLFRATSFGCTRSLHWFRNQLQVDESGATGDGSGAGAGAGGILNQEISITPIPKERVKVQRANILGSADAVMKMHAKRRTILDIVFAGEKGYGSGVTAAFYSATAQTLQSVAENKRSRLWLSGDEIASEGSPGVAGGDGDDDVIRHPNGLFPFPHTAAPAKLIERFRMMGRLAGKALMDERILPLPLSAQFMKLVVGESFTIEEVADIFQSPGRILLSMRAAAKKLAQGSPGVQIDGLAVSEWLDAVSFSFIEPLSQKPLCPGGEDKAVTADNMAEYVESVLNVWMVHGIEAQVVAFREGISEVLPLEKLKLLFVPELLSLLCGDADIKWDAESLRRTMKLAHGYTSASAPVQFFSEFLDEMTVAERRAFLLYATGCPNLPPGGFPALKPTFEVVRRVLETDDVDRALPFARTCTNTLHLPAYSSKEALVRQMRFAIANSRGVIDRD